MSNKLNTQEFINYLAEKIDEAEVHETTDTKHGTNTAVLILFTLSDGREVYVEIK